MTYYPKFTKIFDLYVSRKLDDNGHQTTVDHLYRWSRMEGLNWNLGYRFPFTNLLPI